MSKIQIRNNKQLIVNCCYAAISFALPILLLGVALWYLYHSKIEQEAYQIFTQRYSDFNGTFFIGATHEIRDLNTIRSMIFGGPSYVKSEGIRYLLAHHFDISFIICMLLNITTKRVFTTLMFIRIGLASFASNHLIRKHVGVRGFFSLVLSTAYALSSPILAGSANFMVLNLAIALPIVLSTIDSMTRKRTISSKILFAVSVAFASSCGLYGFITVTLLVISAGFTIIFAAAPQGKRLVSFAQLGCFYALGNAMMAPVIAASFYAAGRPVNPSLLWSASEVKYKIFDVMGTLYDGRILSNASVNGIPHTAVSITILFLFALFLINERIPFSLKLTATISIITIYITITWSVADKLFGIFGTNDVWVYSRLVLFAVLMLFYAGISLRNLGTLTQNDIYLACAILMGILFVHKAVCAPIGPGVFSVLFSFLALVVLTSFFGVMSQRQGSPLESVFASVLVIGLFINTIYILGPSELYDSFLDNKISGESREKVIFVNDTEVPIWGSSNENEYIVLVSDISDEIDDVSLPEIINIASRAELIGDVFIKENTRTVYSHGLTDIGEGVFSVDNPGSEVQTAIRADKLDLSSSYFVYSGFKCHQNLYELYSEVAEHNEFDGEFLYEINPKIDSFNLKIVLSPFKGEHEYSLWKIDNEMKDLLAKSVKSFDDSTIDLSNNSLMNYPDAKTVVTSIDYDDEFIVTDNNGEEMYTFEIAGKLGIVVDEPQSVTELTIKVPIYDMICGLIFSIISILGTIATVLCIKFMKKPEDGGSVNVGQEDN